MLLPACLSLLLLSFVRVAVAGAQGFCGCPTALTPTAAESDGSGSLSAVAGDLGLRTSFVPVTEKLADVRVRLYFILAHGDWMRK